MIDKTIQEAIAKKRDELKTAQQAKLQDRKARAEQVKASKPVISPEDKEARDRMKAEAQAEKEKLQAERDAKKAERLKEKMVREAEKVKAQAERDAKRAEAEKIKQAEHSTKLLTELETKIARLDVAMDNRTNSINKVQSEIDEKIAGLEKAKESAIKNIEAWSKEPKVRTGNPVARTESEIESLTKRIAEMQEKLVAKQTKLNDLKTKGETPESNKDIMAERQKRIEIRNKFVSSLESGIKSRQGYINELNERQTRDTKIKADLMKELANTIKRVNTPANVDATVKQTKATDRLATKRTVNA